MPSSTAAGVACSASSTRAFFSFISVSVAAPTLITATPPGELRQAFLELLAVVVAGGLVDLRAQLLDAPFGPLMRRSLALRRIWTIPSSGAVRPTALTRDTRYRDERRQWSSDGRHILFCRIDEARNRTAWLMRSDGSGAQQLTGPLAPEDPANPDMNWFGYYGTINWKGLIGWRRAKARA
jgi:hypothetical protein